MNKNPVEMNTDGEDLDQMLGSTAADLKDALGKEAFDELTKELGQQSQKVKGGIMATVAGAASGFTGKIMNFLRSDGVGAYKNILLQTGKDELEKRAAQILLDFVWSMLEAAIPGNIDSGVKRVLTRNRYVRFLLIFALTMPASNMILARVPKLAAEDNMELAKFAIVVSRLLTRMLVLEGGQALNLDSIQDTILAWLKQLVNGKAGTELGELMTTVTNVDVRTVAKNAEVMAA